MSEKAAGVDAYVARARSLEPVIRAHAERSERDSRLAPQIVEALHEAGMFRILLPKSLNGGGLSIPESLRVFEEVAKLDASTAWNLAICADGPLFGHFVARHAFEAIFGDPRAVLVGSLNPASIRITACEGGWRFSGRASYLSGSAQATWVQVSGLVFRDDKPQLIEGAPVVRTGVFPIKHCTFLDTWRVTGMRGTGSDDCSFEDVFVPDAFSYRWANPEPTWDCGAFGRIPLTTQLGGALSTVAVGVAQHVLDAFTELATSKVRVGDRAALRERPLAQTQLAQAAGWVRAARAYLREANAEVWRMGEAGERFDFAARAAARLASVTATKLCAQAVDLIHDAVGMSGVQVGSDIERAWRDIHTLTQHVILGTGRYEVVGRVMLGLDPGSPVI
ncbi:MAG TPA: acyl-CoA dehydrogenase family protein [Myxococcota bacterium]|nr:acyl-CoA dehydrogenase family protein [Myxococcota bacterium]